MGLSTYGCKDDKHMWPDRPAIDSDSLLSTRELNAFVIEERKFYTVVKDAVPASVELTDYYFVEGH